MGTEREFDAIFYDLGGTLRLVERDAAFEAEARRKIAEMCGEKGDPDEFCKFLDYRYAGYRKWCFETMREAPEEELWTKWLTPEYDRDLIRRNAIELTIEYRNKDGRRVVAPNGAQSIKDLYANGYKLGIISNLVTSQEIPRWLEADDLGKYFGAVLLSCVEGIQAHTRTIWRLLEKYRVPVIVSSDAHDPSGVGRFALAKELLEQEEMDEELILNLDAERVQHFLLDPVPGEEAQI